MAFREAPRAFTARTMSCRSSMLRASRSIENVALSQEVRERQAILLLRLRTSAPRERSSPAMETAGTCAAKAAQSTPPSESYGTVPLRSARVVSSVTWPPLSVVPTLRTRIVPSESSAPMPVINIAFIIRLDPERIIVAPMLIPGRSNFVVESSGNLVAPQRRLRTEGTAENSGSRSEIFPLPGGGVKNAWIARKRSLHSSHSKCVQGRC